MANTDKEVDVTRRALIAGVPAAIAAASTLGSAPEAVVTEVAAAPTAPLKPIELVVGDFANSQHRLFGGGRFFLENHLSSIRADLDSGSVRTDYSKTFDRVEKLYEAANEIAFMREPPYDRVTLGEIKAADLQKIQYDLTVPERVRGTELERFTDRSKYLRGYIDYIKSFGFYDNNDSLTLSAIAQDFERRCKSAARQLIEDSYRANRLAMVEDYHADNYHAGKLVHDTLLGLEDESNRTWILDYFPRHVLDHIDALYQFSRFNRLNDSKSKTLQGHIFPLGFDPEGNFRFHIALDATYAEAALAKFWPEDLALPALEKARYGMILTVGSEHLEAVTHAVMPAYPPSLLPPAETETIHSDTIAEREEKEAEQSAEAASPVPMVLVPSGYVGVVAGAIHEVEDLRVV